MVSESAIPIGLVASEKFDVTNEDTIAAQVAGDLPPVLGTFVLIKWMESVAGYMVQPYLPEGRISVGAQIDVEHLAPSPVGQKVHIEATYIGTEGAFLSFHIVAHDEVELIGRATHKRAVIAKPLLDRIILRKSRA